MLAHLANLCPKFVAAEGRADKDRATRMPLHPRVIESYARWSSPMASESPPEGGTKMVLRGLGFRVDQALNSVSRGRSYSRIRTQSSPPASGEPISGEILSGETDAPVSSDYYECAKSYVGSDNHDTIPSPPPELESAPWHDER